jgi:D-alanyl-D-alanine carboxypeptidase/D-alanyl-D-alanine-endopeptidase (penicillin-binding protein 4)
MGSISFMDTHNTSLYKAGIVSLILFLGHAPSSNAEDLRALQSPLLRAASVGIEIAEVQADGNLRTLYAQDAGRALMPASTLKLVTTATALTLCGAETRVETSVGYTGTLDAAGCLQGDVIIRGSGDASLASRYDSRSPQTFVTEAAQALKRAGVKHIRGRIIGDEEVALVA